MYNEEPLLQVEPCPEECWEKVLQVYTCCTASVLSTTREAYIQHRNWCLSDPVYLACRELWPDCPWVHCPEWIDEEEDRGVCGPDSADWLEKKMNELIDWARREGVPDIVKHFGWMGIGKYTSGNLGGGLWLLEVVQKGYLDFSENGQTIFKRDGCATGGCGDTATIGDHCVAGDNMEDLAFGALCTTIFPLSRCISEANNYALKKWGVPETPQAIAGIRAGARAVVGGRVTSESLLDAVSQAIGSMKDKSKCDPCNQKIGE